MVVCEVAELTGDDLAMQSQAIEESLRCTGLVAGNNT